MRQPLADFLTGAPVPDAIAAAVQSMTIRDFTVGTNELQLVIEAAGGSTDVPLWPGADPAVLVLRRAAGLTLNWDGVPSIALALDQVDVRLPAVMRPASKVSGQWVADTTRRVEVPITASNGVVLRWHAVDGVTLGIGTGAPAGISISVPAAMIGDSGIVISCDGVSVSLADDAATLTIARAAVHLPDDLPAVPDLAFEDAAIGPNGFSGTVSGTWDLAWDDATRAFVGGATGSLLGVAGGLARFGLTFRDNVMVGSDIRGMLVMPYFDSPVEVTLQLAEGGAWQAQLAGTGGQEITLTKDDLIALSLRSLAIGREPSGLVEVVVSGGLEPLLMASDGLEWPRLDITDLGIDTLGRFRIKEAWLDLKDLSTLDLFGFHFELNRIGLGYQEADDKLWLDLTGSVKLIEQIPVGLGVEGFRLTWPRTLFEQLSIDGPPTLDEAIAIAGSLEVKFDGVYLFFGVPGAVEFEGLIRFIKDAQVVAFAGDMALRVPATGLSAEAGLMIGMNLAEPPYPFLYLYFGIELPAGIPLAQSGLALKGALGLFGLNVAPAKAPEENWYYDWYKRGPVVGAHPTNKWQNERDALAVGIGVTITTVDGYVKGVRGLVVLALPGPLLIIEGRALILSGLTPAEPPLRALAVLDGREQTIQFNVEAEAELIEDMLDAYGMLEAFFDFKDLTNWHLYLGQDDPRERRIHANVLKLGDGFLFKADAYLMIDTIGAQMLRSRMGVFVGFKPPIPDIGPVTVTFDGVIEGRGEVTMLPEQFSGELDLSATIALEVMGTGIQLAASAGMTTEGPKPLSVGAEISVSAEMPAPLDPIEASFEFTWELPEPPEIAAPLTIGAVGSPFAVGGPPLEIYARPAIDTAADWRRAATQSTIAPLDTRPILGFGHEMNDAARESGGAAFGRHPDGALKSFDAGWMRFTPSLLAVRLYEHRKGQPWPATLDGWTLIGSSRDADVGPGVERLPGVWMTEADPQEPASPPARRVQLWTNNPLLHAVAALGPGYSIAGREALGTSHAEQLLGLHPELLVCERRKPRRICVTFDDRKDAHFARERTWSQHGLQLTAIDAAVDVVGAGRTGKACLRGSGRLAVRFPEPVSDVRITFCITPKVPNGELAAQARTARTVRTPAEVTHLVESARRKKMPVPDPAGCHVPVVSHLVAAGEVWTIRGDEGFECLQLFSKQDFSIAEICYTTTAEKTIVARIDDQCALNHRADSEPQPVLRPGSYYRLEIETQISGELAGRGDLEDLYRLILQALHFGDPRAFTQAVFFQTEGPPSNLAEYVKCTTPMPGGRVFRRDGVSIRFKRPNMRQLYGQPPHRLELLVRNAGGHLLDGFESSWQKARSASLLREERIWREHRIAAGLPVDPTANDDVLAGASVGGGLEPSARYEVLVSGGEGGALLAHDAFAALSSDAWRGDRDGWSVSDATLRHDAAAAANLVNAGAVSADVDVVTEIRLNNHHAGGVLVRAAAAAGDEWRAVRVSIAAPQPGELVVRAEAMSGDPDRASAQASRRLAQHRLNVDTGLWHRLRVSIVANRLRVWVFDELAIDRSDLALPPGGAVGLYGGGAGVRFRRFSVRDAVLHRVAFTSSAFNGFDELVQSANVADPIDASAVGPTAAQRDAALSAASALTSAEWAWHCAVIDFDDEALPGGRQAIEQARVTLRDARAAHDAAFRSLAEAISAELAYAPVAAHLERYVLRDDHHRVFGVWLRSPETLDLRRPVAGGTAAFDHVGRTTLELRRGAAIAVDVFHDAESTQLIILRSDRARWPAGVYRISLSYHRDHGDHLRDDHRYDRPVESGPGGETVTASVTFLV